MASLTAKERAILLTRSGVSSDAIAGILGIDRADVERLMLEADPDVELPNEREATVLEFKVDDLLVPEGTDWSELNVLGTFDIPAGALVTAVIYMERDGAGPADSKIHLIATATPNTLWDDPVLTSGELDGEALNDFALVKTDFVGPGEPLEEPAVDLTISVGLATTDTSYVPGPLSGSVTLAHARAAFLVL